MHTHAHTHRHPQNESGGRYWSYELIANDSRCTETHVSPLGRQRRGVRHRGRPPPPHYRACFRQRQVIDWPDKQRGPRLTFERQSCAALPENTETDQRGDGRGELRCLWGEGAAAEMVESWKPVVFIKVSSLGKIHFAEEFDRCCVSNLLLNSPEWEDSYFIPAARPTV